VTVLNVAGLLADRPGAIRDHPIHDHYVTLGPDVQLAGPIQGWLRLQRTNRGVWIRGEVDGLLRRVCGRCTDPYEEEVRVNVDEEFLPTVDPHTGVPLQHAEEDADVQRINAWHEIDLTPVIRDELALTEPIVGRCRPDCPGLCPGCGRRMDEGTCACAVVEPDPRLAVLARFLDGEQE
jgi:uncharacterized metal-binding protein YceD (DUF177 family)